MPRGGSDLYSKPAGTTAAPNTTIESAKFNTVVDDIVDDLNLARPVAVGGTGATTAANARANLWLASISDDRIKTSVPLVDSSDTSKKLSLDLSGITTSTTRTWVLPNASSTFVGTGTTQTLTNKTLTSPIMSDPTTSGTVTFGGATLDMQISDGQLGWGGGGDYVTWVTTEGLEGYENSTFSWRIGSGAETRIQSVYDATTASAANVVVSSSGNLRRSTSSGEYKIDRAPVSTDGFMDLFAVEYASTHKADIGKRFIGFIAEQVAKMFPWASVDGGKDYDTRAVLAINWTKTQEHERRIGALERRLNAIEEG